MIAGVSSTPTRYLFTPLLVLMKTPLARPGLYPFTAGYRMHANCSNSGDALSNSDGSCCVDTILGPKTFT